MKKYTLLIVLGVLCSFLIADYGPIPFEELNAKSGGNISILAHENEQVVNVNLAQELSLMNFKVGLGINLVFPEDKRPPGLALIEVKSIGWDDGTTGLRYGYLSNQTLGYGLIMDRYKTTAKATAYFDPSYAGVSAYTKMLAPVGLRGVFTNSKVVGVRLTYDLFKLPGLGKTVMAE